MKSIFVTATDTGVGKTFVSTCLLAFCAERGIKLLPMKPFECGDSSPRDSQRLWQASGQTGLPPPWACSYYFKAPQAPSQAARKENRGVDLQRVFDDFQHAKTQSPAILVEGCGGLLVPLRPEDPKYTVAHLAQDLKLPLLVVARAGLGTLNHSLLTLSAAHAAGLSVLGIVLNHPTAPAGDDPSIEDNAKTLHQITGVPVWGPLPHVAGGDPAQALKLPIFREILEKILAMC